MLVKPTFWKDKLALVTSHNHSALGIQALFVSIVIVTVVLAILLINLYYFLPQSTTPSAELLIEAIRGRVAPEPVERFVFMVLAAVVPILTFVSVIASASSKASGYLNKAARLRSVAMFAAWIVAVMLLTPFFGSSFLAAILGEYSEEYRHVYAELVLSSAISLFWCFWIASAVTPKLSRPIFFNIIVWLIFIISASLQIFSFRWVGINSVGTSGNWVSHADAVFYALSQVVAGKTLLVDLPSQYGLWVEMLAPLFRITGLSVLGLSSFSAILQLLSLSSLFFVLTKLVRIPSLRAMGGIALVLVTFETVQFFVGFDDQYWQYWPIRFFWPAISVLVFYIASQIKTILSSALLSLLGVVGTLWNVDSGMFIVVAYGAFLVARLLFLLWHRRRPAQVSKDPWAVSKYVTAIAVHIGITVLGIIGFFVALTLKSGSAPSLVWLFEYQKIFYDFGLMMLPLPRQIDPWMSVLGVYLLGLLVSLYSWLHNSARRRMDTVFYLSMLGLGLFIYYQGRSHVLNLVSVCWPALMIAVILADEFLRAIRAKILPKTQIILPAVAVSLVLLCCYSLVSHGALIFTGVQRKFATREISDSPQVVNELAFIRQYATNKHECLILSRLQGIYYAESGLASPLKGPGLVEMLLKADQDLLVSQVLSGGVQCVFLGTGIKLDEQMMRKKYSFVATNTLDTMQYLEPKP